MTITSFVLVDADSDQDILEIENGYQIALNTLQTRNLNIRINVSGDVESVAIAFNTDFMTENVAPYAVFANNGQDYFGWQASAGSYTLTATPYSQDNAGGTAGTPQTITFTLTSGTG